MPADRDDRLPESVEDTIVAIYRAGAVGNVAHYSLTKARAAILAYARSEYERGKRDGELICRGGGRDEA